MKIGKYPVKHSYKIPQLISDVFSLAIIMVIFTATAAFFDDYAALLDRMRYGADNVATVVEKYDSSFVWRQWLALIFPALAVGVVVAYIILLFKSKKFANWNITKLTAQIYYDTYAFCVSLCKIPILLAIFDIMYITHQKLFGNDEISWFSIQFILDALIITIIVRFGIHRLRAAEKMEEDDNIEEVTAVVKTPLSKEK